MTLDANGEHVLPGYYKYCILTGFLVGAYRMYLIGLDLISSPVTYFPPQHLLTSTPVSEIIPNMIEWIPIFIIAFILSFVLIRIWGFLDRVGLPREDEVH